MSRSPEYPPQVFRPTQWDRENQSQNDNRGWYNSNYPPAPPDQRPAIAASYSYNQPFNMDSAPIILDPELHHTLSKPDQPEVTSSQPYLEKMLNLQNIDYMRVPTMRLTNSYPNPIEYDGKWYKHITKCPLQDKHGYLPDDEPMVADLGPHSTPGMYTVTDAHGPPEASRWYKLWQNDDESMDSVFTQQDLDKAYDRCSKHYNDFDITRFGVGHHFVLRLDVRKTLYERLFAPIRFKVTCYGTVDVPVDNYVEVVIASKLSTIACIEWFLLHVLHQLVYHYDVPINSIPRLSWFIKDFYILLDDLISGTTDELPNSKISVLDEEIKVDQVTWWLEPKQHFVQKWKKGWEKSDLKTQSVVFSDSIMRNYICGVFDAMFGIFLAPGDCPFHKSTIEGKSDQLQNKIHWTFTQQTAPRCLNNEFYFWEKIPPQPETETRSQNDAEHSAPVSLNALDAILIEVRTPYRFKETNRLSQHLAIDAEDRVLIYPKWWRFLMLRHHRVLIADARPDYDDETVSRFQLLSRSLRTGEERVNGQGGDLRFIAYELLRTYALLFYRRVTNKKGHFYADSNVFPWLRCWGMEGDVESSEDIAKRLHLDPSEGFNQLMHLLAPHRETGEGPQAADFRIFRKRLENINRSLNAWKPSTIPQLLVYRGWVEEETDFGQLFLGVFGIPFVFVSVIVGIITMIFTIFPAK